MAEITGKSPRDIEVPVIGGHAGVTIMPVFSQDGGKNTTSEKVAQTLGNLSRDPDLSRQPAKTLGKWIPFY